MWVDHVKHWKCAMASFAIVATVASAPSPSSASSWFWEEVPPRIDGGSRAKAMQVVANARSRKERQMGNVSSE